jgi:enoyl-CoA hydratase/carnithine racemase
MHRGERIDEVVFREPILSVAVLRELTACLDELAITPRPLVLSSDHPRIFLAGADLAEIADLDSDTCLGYARFGRAALGRLGQHPAPTVAAVSGSCSGGGFDLAMSCDLVLAEANARFGHPGVRRGLVTGWGGTAILPRRLGSSRYRRTVLEGSWLSSDGLPQSGSVRSTGSDLLSEARREALRLAALDPGRLQLHRALRGGAFVDRFRTFVVHSHMYVSLDAVAVRGVRDSYRCSGSAATAAGYALPAGLAERE